MDFELSEEQKLLKQNARTFMEREIIPHVNEYEQMNPFPKEMVHQMFKKIAPLGYLNAPLPKECGGEELDWVSYAVLYEELAKAWCSLAGIVQIQLAAADILCSPAAENHRKYLPELLAGDKIWAAASTEPDVGSNIAEIKTTATLDGDYYVINGTKTWVSCAFWADFVTVLASTDKSLGPKGLSLFIVNKEESPFSTSWLPKIGMRCWVNTELTFEDCRVPKENIIGEPGRGLRYFLEGINIGRCAISMNGLGAAQAAIQAAIQYAKERHQFGKPIGSFQLIQGLISDITAEVEATRFLVYRAFQAMDTKQEEVKYAALAKSLAPKVALSVCARAMEVMGAYGLSTEYPMERYFRDARVASVPDGSTQINQLVAGRQILGMSAFV
jgi:alkylation response protein AidB-like acyl-CoA dehydrogenase